MNKEITLEEYVLTNLHPGDWGCYIRLKDNNLIDGYTTYLIAKKYGINFINVINNS